MGKKKKTYLNYFYLLLVVLIPTYLAFFNDGYEVYKNFFSDSKITPFKENNSSFKVLVFPFKNYSLKTESNLSEAVYEKISQIKIKYNLENLEIKYYDLPAKDINEAKLKTIGEDMNADFIIWGSYEISTNCNGSICIVNFSAGNINTPFQTTEKVNFDMILNSIENGKITESIEFYIYYVLSYLEIYNGGNIDKSIFFLKEAIENTNNKEIKSELEKKYNELNFLSGFVMKEVARDAYNVEPEEAGLKIDSKTYGLQRNTPVFINGIQNLPYYLGGLKYKNRNIKYESSYTSMDSLSPINPQALIDLYVIYDQEDKLLDTIYFFTYSKRNFFKPPNGYTFKPENVRADNILEDM